MSDYYFDADAEQRAAAEEAYLESEECVIDAWDEAINAQPDHLTAAVVDWYQTRPAFQTAVQDVYDGERTVA